jgi:hypothetical protein
VIAQEEFMDPMKYIASIEAEASEFGETFSKVVSVMHRVTKCFEIWHTCKPARLLHPNKLLNGSPANIKLHVEQKRRLHLEHKIIDVAEHRAKP